MIARLSFRALMLGLLASCFAHSPKSLADPARPSAPSASRPESPSSAKPTPPSSSAPASPPSPGGVTADVEVNGKDSTGAPTFAIGRPAFQVIDDVGNDTLTYRSAAGRIFLKDAKLVTVWDARTGEALQRIAPTASVSPITLVSMAVSDNGAWLVTDADNGVRLFPAPFDKPSTTFGCRSAVVVAHGGGVLACGRMKLTIWDVAKRQAIATLPSTVPDEVIKVARFAADDRSLIWATNTGVWRWSFANGGAIAPVYQAPSRIVYATLAAAGTAAYVQLEGSKAFVVDVATGKTKPVLASYISALSPSGKRIARGATTLEVVDVATDKVLWSTKTTTAVSRIAFGDTDDDIAFLVDDRLRTAKLPAAPTPLPSVARFAGWLAPGVAAIARGDTLRSYNFDSRTWGVVDTGSLAPSLVPKMPPWATWIASRDSDGIVAAERNQRHDAPIEKRDLTSCAPKLRVWTPKGGAKTLAMACSKPEREGAEDPGWQIGGGWALSVSSSKATVFDARTGRKALETSVPAAASNKPELASAYWHATLSPAGDWMALIWRRPVIVGEGPGGPDPREDAMHIAERAANARCEEAEHGCLMLYTVELWTLKGTPRRVWQSKLERPVPGSGVSVPATPSGALSFAPNGNHLLIGFADGEVRAIDTAHPDTARSERLTVAPIQALAADPAGQWIEVVDAAGDQRVWRVNR